MSVEINFKYHVLGDECTYENGTAYRKDLPPGSCQWVPNHHNDNPHACIAYTCPCGCGAVGAISVKKGQKIPQHWEWDGNVQAPTLTPSILKKFGCCWHGFLTGGVFISV